MNNICVIAYSRSSCENFISQMNLKRVAFNSFDIFYNREYSLKIPEYRHVIKIYVETITNKKIQSMLEDMKNYDFIYFKRGNITKNFMTKKMQDNLIGEYGKDYNTFKICKEDLLKYSNNMETHHKNFTNIFKDKHYFHYDPDLYKFTIPDELLSKGCFANNTFHDAFDDEICKKFIINYKEFGL